MASQVSELPGVAARGIRDVQLKLAFLPGVGEKGEAVARGRPGNFTLLESGFPIAGRNTNCSLRRSQVRDVNRESRGWSITFPRNRLDPGDTFAIRRDFGLLEFAHAKHRFDRVSQRGSHSLSVLSASLRSRHHRDGHQDCQTNSDSGAHAFHSCFSELRGPVRRRSTIANESPSSGAQAAKSTSLRANKRLANRQPFLAISASVLAEDCPADATICRYPALTARCIVASLNQARGNLTILFRIAA